MVISIVPFRSEVIFEHDQFTLNQLRLSVLKEIQTDIQVLD